MSQTSIRKKYSLNIFYIYRYFIRDCMQKAIFILLSLCCFVFALCPANMTFVKGGSFIMGSISGRDEVTDKKDQGAFLDASSRFFTWELPANSVTISDFCISTHEVTQKEWKDIMGTTIHKQRDKSRKAGIPLTLVGEGDNYPMYYVSWHEAVEYVQKLSKKTGKNYRLLTEAEWEYAARGGDKSKGYKYAGSNDIGSVAWYNDNSGKRVYEVCKKSRNELNICDMSGNVHEWVSDWYGSYTIDSKTNPQGPNQGITRVLRGGSWLNFSYWSRIAFRSNSNPNVRYDYVGFRVALNP